MNDSCGVQNRSKGARNSPLAGERTRRDKEEMAIVRPGLEIWGREPVYNQELHGAQKLSDLIAKETEGEVQNGPWEAWV